MAGTVSVFCFECAVKACVIAKTAFCADLIWLFALGKKLPRHLQPLFLNITVDAGTHLPVEFMAQMVFAYKKLLGKPVKG